jgi:catechol 2,3-dioxygenase
LYHIGWCIGETTEQLVRAKKELEEREITIEGMSDHVITHSLYIRDPDGNEVELYVDCPDYDWKNDREWIDDPVRPLQL